MAPRRRGKAASKSARRWSRRLLVACLVVLIASVAAAATAALWAVTILPRSLPSLTALEKFDPIEGTKIYDENDEVITELHVERRLFVPLGQIPKPLRDAI